MSASKEGMERKQRSEERLRSEGVRINASLPEIETEEEATRRSTTDIAYRALALLLVAAKGAGLAEEEVLDRAFTENHLSSHLSPDEAAFIGDPSPPQRDVMNFAWRLEAAWVLLWALGYVKSLDRPDTICDAPHAGQFLLREDPDGFIQEARLRPMAEILDEADLIYRYRWAIVAAELADQEAPADLNPGIAYERHYALNWLVGYMDQEWDDITTDT